MKLQRELADRTGGLLQGGRIRWVDAPNIHVTLKFLGEVDDALVPMIEDRLRALTRPLFPFEVACCEVGAFPSLDRPRVLWAGLDEKGAEVMGLLRQTIERELGELGFAADERAYAPHVTLGRIKTTSAVDLNGVTQDLAKVSFGTSFLKDIVLFESRLSADGASYHVRRRFLLGEA